MITREQQRMKKAWDTLVGTGRFGNDPDKWGSRPDAKEYMSAIKKTPARIHICGLGQALAFLRSRGKAPSRNAEGDVASITLGILGETGQTDLLGLLRQRDADFLFLATEEAIEVCGWLARYLAGAGVKGEDEDDMAQNGANSGKEVGT